jgi:hypothetical protein
MVFAIVVQHAVGIVVPASFLAEVELRTKRLVVQGIRPLDLVRLIDDLQAAAAGHQRVDPQLGHLPSKRSRQVQVVFVQFDRPHQILRRHHHAAVALHDVVDVDMPPSAGSPVDDSNDDFLACQVADVPRIPFELFAAAGLDVGTGRGAHHPAVQQQVDARLARVTASANQEVQKTPLDRQRRRGQRAGRFVAGTFAPNDFPQFSPLPLGAGPMFPSLSALERHRPPPTGNGSEASRTGNHAPRVPIPRRSRRYRPTWRRLSETPLSVSEIPTHVGKACQAGDGAITRE